jgi:Domain of unknown function (DUF4189)
MRRSCFLTIIIVGAALITSGASADTWVALAVSVSSNDWGDAYNYDSRAEAESVAMGLCRKFRTDCRIVLSGTNGWCVSMARGDTGSGWSRRADLKTAQSSALAECGKQSSSCKLVFSRCATSGTGYARCALLAGVLLFSYKYRSSDRGGFEMRNHLCQRWGWSNVNCSTLCAGAC